MTDELCGKCDKAVSTSHQATQCELCEIWFHRKCINMALAQYQLLGSDSPVSLHWFCRCCDKVAVNVIADVRKLKVSQTLLQEQVKLLQEKLSDEFLQQKVDAAVKSALSVMAPPSLGVPGLDAAQGSSVLPDRSYAAALNASSFVKSESFRKIVFEDTREIAEREKRRRSVVVSGLGTELGTFVGSFADISEKLIGAPVTIANLVRINDHLVRGSIPNDPHRSALLSNAVNLSRDATTRHIFIRRDLTYKQRQELRQARDEKRSRESNGTNDNSGAGATSRTFISSSRKFEGSLPSLMEVNAARAVLTPPNNEPIPLTSQNSDPPTDLASSVTSNAAGSEDTIVPPVVEQVPQGFRPALDHSQPSQTPN